MNQAISVLSFLLIILYSQQEIHASNVSSRKRKVLDSDIEEINVPKRRILPMDHLAAHLIATGPKETEPLNRELIKLPINETSTDEPSLRPIKNLILGGADVNTAFGSIKASVLHYALALNSCYLME